MQGTAKLHPSGSIIKQYLKPFILRIHPDFFHKYPREKRINAASLQKLYEVIGPLIPKRAVSTSQINVDSKVELEFHYKHEDELKKVQCSIATPRPYNRSFALWQTTYDFLSLCHQVGVHIDTQVFDQVEQQLEEFTKYKGINQGKSLREIFVEELKQSLALDQTSTASIRNKTRHDHDQWLLNEFADSNQLLFFGESLSQEQKLIFMNTAYNYLLNNKIKETWWNKVPVIVINAREQSNFKSGVIVMNYDITEEDLAEYLNQNLKRIRLEYQDIVAKKLQRQ
ncbi:6813_t:CDS:2 [Paraglomus occultum]|uniref:6813_t:CDS:1 n=1 Tax=Paraglomus occultum TaxID=144539 RepID=A0A9N9CM00_9GLOM|nr:6813_t:CDS:2 [Paraglomus occultum]